MMSTPRRANYHLPLSLTHTYTQISAVLISVFGSDSSVAALSRVTRVFKNDLEEGFYTVG